MSHQLRIDTNGSKADYLVSEFGAFRLPHMPVIFTDEAAIVGIIHEGGDEYAFYCYSDAEMKKIASRPGDTRDRSWLVMEKNDCIKLCGL